LGEEEGNRVYSHAAVLLKKDEDLYLLDASEDGPVNLTQNNDLAKEWLLDI
jgi:hypothetical protein